MFTSNDPRNELNTVAYTVFTIRTLCRCDVRVRKDFPRTYFQNNVSERIAIGNINRPTPLDNRSERDSLVALSGRTTIIRMANKD
jgi:hypothetical protein